MRKKDLTPFLHFLTRTGMWVFGKASRDTIITFLFGYELGTERKCKLTEELEQFLFERHQLPKNAFSWWGQVESYAADNRLSWVASFKRLVLQYFYHRFDWTEEPEWKEILLSGIQSLIARLEPAEITEIHGSWIEEWSGLVDLEESLFCNMWNAEQLQKIKAITQKITEAEKNQRKNT